MVVAAGVLAVETPSLDVFLLPFQGNCHHDPWHELSLTQKFSGMIQVVEYVFSLLNHKEKELLNTRLRQCIIKKM
jgi:hypothetical protein